MHCQGGGGSIQRAACIACKSSLVHTTLRPCTFHFFARAPKRSAQLKHLTQRRRYASRFRDSKSLSDKNRVKTVRSANFLPQTALSAFWASSASMNSTKTFPSPLTTSAGFAGGRGTTMSLTFPNLSHSSLISSTMSLYSSSSLRTSGKTMFCMTKIFVALAAWAGCCSTNAAAAAPRPGGIPGIWPVGMPGRPMLRSPPPMSPGTRLG
mmetsp:Transcript_25883/g.48278  ORF Transcript_25883/g.48278 Transcript_25883/m.48278 type:complete len:209 (-) Transcript_25883:971-1597(-)